MSKENKTVVLLVKDGVLNETERNVFQMVRERPDCWSSGCVTGYPEFLFTEEEREALRNQGIGKRFSM